jgi:hypothetical protein
MPIWQRLAGGKISFPDWGLFLLILKVPFSRVKDRSSIEQNLGKENPVSGNQARQWPMKAWKKNRNEEVRIGRLLPGKNETPGRGPGGSGDPPMPLDPDRRNLFSKGSLLLMLDSSPIRDGHRRSSIHCIGVRGTNLIDIFSALPLIEWVVSVDFPSLGMFAAKARGDSGEAQGVHPAPGGT